MINASVILKNDARSLDKALSSKGLISKKSCCLTDDVGNGKNQSDDSLVQISDRIGRDS